MIIIIIIALNQNAPQRYKYFIKNNYFKTLIIVINNKMKLIFI